ncbi:AsnC family protein [Streptomyces sp. BA2]|uniref:LexA family protein n=1 Tax=Streptomyces sp. BA2 TaxID=436595 RepID=UPI0013238569|nr:hypothetical protein [Streptomyces sp. BA2]
MGGHRPAAVRPGLYTHPHDRPRQAPTVREIGAAVGLSSHPSVLRRLQRLEQTGPPHALILVWERSCPSPPPRSSASESFVGGGRNAAHTQEVLTVSPKVAAEGDAAGLRGS